MPLIFASNNAHKLQEISSITQGIVRIVSLQEIGCYDDIPETGETLTDNALQKARYVFERYGGDVFADDTGLEIDALNGAPGVYTARFAGPQCSPADNIAKTLECMQGITDRTAYFKTVIAGIISGKEYVFEGVVKGEIAEQVMGDGGFGYDPIFIPDGYDISFAQMAMSEKNTISHRGRATAKFVEFLRGVLMMNDE